LKGLPVEVLSTKKFHCPFNEIISRSGMTLLCAKTQQNRKIASIRLNLGLNILYRLCFYRMIFESQTQKLTTDTLLIPKI
jgi:hypothetical protein